VEGIRDLRALTGALKPSRRSRRSPVGAKTRK
jgi:hypothetical protein